MSWFWILTCIVGCFLTSVLFIRYVAVLEAAAWQKAVIFALFMIPGCVFPLTSYELESVLGRGFFLYRYSMYFLFIFCVILFTMTVFRDVVWAILAGVSRLSGKFSVPSMTGGVWLGRLNFATVVAAFLCTAFSFYEGVRIPAVKTVEIVSAKIEREYKIAVLSDLHIHRVLYPWKIWCTALTTNREKPDVILLPGDIIDDDPSKVEALIRSLGALKAEKGVYFVSGNHEFYAGYKASSDALKKLGFSDLDNAGAAIGKDLFIGGVPDVRTALRIGMKADPAKAFRQAPANGFRLLMSHTPTDFKTGNDFDLEVSGHTHGGQIFPFHLFVKAAHKYVSGLYDLAGGAKIYVSNGAGQWGPQMRFLAPSEITILKLVPQNRDEK